MSDTLRSGLIRLAFANPSLRADLLPLIEKEAAGPSYKDYVEKKRKKGEKPLAEDAWESRVKGKSEGGGAEKSEGKESEGGGKTKSPIPVKMYEYIGPDAVAIGKSIKDGVSLPPKKSETVLGVLERAIAGVKSGKDSADPTVLKHYKSLAKHLKGEVDKRNKALVKHPQSVRDIANEHDLPAVDVAEVQAQAKSLADKNAKSRKSPEQRKQEFLKNIDPSKYSPKELAAMKERIKKMSAGDFEKMVFALAEDEGGAEGGGKTASLRSGLIRLAFANPTLRPTLLPLIEKHAGEMDAELDEDADPTSHDQNLPEHYYFNKGAAKGESVEAILKQFASPASKNQNKPESYYGLAPKGKQAAKEKNDYSPSTFESIDLRDDLVKALKKKGLEVEEGSTDNTLYIDGEKVAIHGSHLEGEYVKEWIRKPSRKEWLDEAVKLLGKKASVKVAAGPDSTGRNWKEKNDGGKHRWVWAGQSGDLAFTVTEHEAPFGMYYKMSVLLDDGTMLQTVGQKLKPTDWFQRAVSIYRASQGVMLDFSDMPEKWKRVASVMTAAAKAPAKLKGKKLDEAISKAYYKHGNNVQVDIMNIGKIYAAGKSAYEGAGTLEEADQALDEAMKAAIAKYRVN